MKLTVQLLIMTAWHTLIIAARSVESADVDQEALLKRAADQLDRLMPYRKNANDREEIDLTKLLETWKTVADQNHLDETKGEADGQFDLPWEVLEIRPNQDAAKRTDDGKADDEMIRIDVITDPKYAALMRDRIKRGFTHGTASLLTSIAGGVLSGVASASSSSAGKVLSSSSSAEYGKPYGAPVEHSYSYGEKHFGPWDFKKAIFNTLFQALKAIGGGVLALKGQLVKGSGYLLAAKSKVFGKTGDAITSFGKHLAASALSKPHPETYYDHSIQHIATIESHDHGYHGPSGSDDYTEDYSPHKIYGVPSDADNDQGGLLIVTKTDPDEHSDQHTDTVVQEKPNLATLEESFGGPPSKGEVVANLLSSVPKGSAYISTETTDHPPIDHHNSIDSSAVHHPVPVLGALDHYVSNYGNPNYNEQNYHADDDALHTLPSKTALPHHHHHLPHLDDPTNVELQQIQYPKGGALLNSANLKLPSHDSGIDASLIIDTEPQIAPLKVSHSSVFELPSKPHVSFHGPPHFTNHVYGNLDNPLKISLLNSPAAYHWQTHGSLVPTFNLHQFHKRNALHRRMFSERLARYSSLQRHRQV